MNSPDVLINGAAADSLSVTDRGLQYGDGLFETMAYSHDTVRFFAQHFARLERGCRVLGMTVPRRSAVQADIDRLTAGQERCVIKLIVTRGIGGWGYTPGDGHTPQTRIVQRLPWPPVTDNRDGLRCAVLATTLGSNRQLAGIKHLNRIEQVLAAREVKHKELDEGLVCNQDGFLIEAVSANVLLVFAQRIVTPRLDTAGVQGIMRDMIISKLAASGTEVSKEYLYVDTLASADEIILCNSIRGVRAVGRLGDLVLPQRTFFDRLTQLLSLD